MNYSIPRGNSQCICKNLQEHKRQMRRAKIALAGGYLVIAGICVGGLYWIAYTGV